MGDMRIFTLEEAESTLPLVARVVGDIQEEYPRWRAAVARYELLSGGARADWGETRINLYLGELTQVGCLFKGFEAGLVDFYSLREDRLVFLCWHLGEEHIAYWHEVDAGYDGRRPLHPEEFSERLR